MRPFRKYTNSPPAVEPHELEYYRKRLPQFHPIKIYECPFHLFCCSAGCSAWRSKKGERQKRARRLKKGTAIKKGRARTDGFPRVPTGRDFRCAFPSAPTAGAGVGAEPRGLDFRCAFPSALTAGAGVWGASPIRDSMNSQRTFLKPLEPRIDKELVGETLTQWRLKDIHGHQRTSVGSSALFYWTN